MRKIIRFMTLLFIVISLGGVALWSLDRFRAGSPKETRQQVLDIDKECRMNADTGSCVCRHRRTGERLSIPYRECVNLVRSR